MRFGSHAPFHAAALVAALAAGTSCGGGGDEGATDSGMRAARASADTVAHLTTIQGFEAPESARYDAGLDLWFVSNVNGPPSAKDGNGYISRVTADGVVDSARFIAGGRGGATLNAPKGIFIRHDTLWVADIDALRAFSTRTGEPRGTIEMGRMGATMLNDIAAGSDGAIYVTDTGIRFGVEGATPHIGKLFRVENGTATVALSADALHAPNGIAWDGSGNRFLIGAFSGDSVLSWTPGDSMVHDVATGPGQYDGLAVLDDGRILVSSWSDSSVHVIENGGMRRIVTGVPSPAAFGIDSKRSRIAVPLLGENRVELFSLPLR